MRALSLSQPWASLVARGAKRVETRSWRTGYSGPLAIHAAKGFPTWAQALCLDPPFPLELFGQAAASEGRQETLARIAGLPRGAVIATARLVCCVPTADVFAPSILDQHGTPFEETFGDYSEGRWMWLLEDVVALEEPVPARGALSLWEWTPPAGWRQP